MKFGLHFPKKRTGAEVGIYIFQFASLLPAIYILVSSGYMALFTKNGIPGFLCALGFSAIPRWETFGLSYLYRLTSSESAVCFGLLFTALAIGFATNKLLRAKEKTAFTVRVIYAALLGADLIIRLLPLSFNSTFGFAAAVCGFALRTVCLGLAVADLAVYKKEQPQPSVKEE